MTCGGSSVGGYCWYYAAVSESCDTVCSSRGGCNLAGTKDYAGSAGTNANCGAVMSALGNTGAVYAVTDSSPGIGCYVSQFNTEAVGRVSSTTTTCGDVFGHRACACNN